MLTKKLIRTALKYKAQFLSMMIMVGIGLGIFIGFNMEWVSIQTSTEHFFTDTGFADYRILREQGFSEEDLNQVKNLPSVQDASRILNFNTVSRADDDIVSLMVTENTRVTFFQLMKGASYDATDEDGIWISDHYAKSNHLAIGDTMTLLYSGMELPVTIRGTVMAGEYLVCTPDETQLMPDFTTYGYGYVTPALIRKALGFEYYTQIHILSEESTAVMKADVQSLFGNSVVLLTKQENASYAASQSEIEEGKTMGAILPVVFLLIGILTMVTTMHRITANEKTQIGSLKALGFRDRKILLHYTSYAIMVAFFGTLVALGIGITVCKVIMNPDGMMGTYFDMPKWYLPIPAFCWIAVILVDLALILVGFLSVKEMLRGTAADSLKPYVPKKMRSLALERFRFWEKFSFGTRWNLRDIFRHKSRSFMSLFGVFGCSVILTAVFGMNDTLNVYVEKSYKKAFDYKYCINLSEGTSREDALTLAKEYDGDWAASSYIEENGKSVSLTIYHSDKNMVKFMDESEKYLTLENSGVYISRRIADANHLKVGDSMVFSPYGSDEEYTATVAGILLSMTEGLTMTDAYADTIGYPYSISSIYTDKEVTGDSRIANVQNVNAVIDSFDTFMGIMNTMIIVLSIASLLLAAIVLYNLGTLSYIERYREMATLKVVGFQDKRIGQLLISQNIWLTIAGLLVGIPCGVGVLHYLMDVLGSEYELNIHVHFLSYLLSVGLVLGVSLLVGFLISSKNKKIDMVEALKRVD